MDDHGAGVDGAGDGRTRDEGGGPDGADRPTYRVTARDVTGHTTVGDGNSVSGDIGASAGAARPVTQEDLAELRGAFARVHELLEGLDGIGERDKGAAADRLEELEAAVTDGDPDVPTMKRIRTWFATKLPAALGAVSALLLHPTAALLVENAGGDTVAAFGDLLRCMAPGEAGDGNGNGN
ncbi:hypothetical protein ACWGJ2_33400 [Streptomyces sp. NPDC054796]